MELEFRGRFRALDNMNDDDNDDQYSKKGKSDRGDNRNNKTSDQRDKSQDRSRSNFQRDPNQIDYRLPENTRPKKDKEERSVGKYNDNSTKPRSHRLQLAEYFKRNPDVEIGNEQLEKIMDREYIKFIENFRDAYVANSNNIPYYLLNMINKDVFIEQFMETVEKHEDYDDEDGIINLILSKYIMDNITKDSEILAIMKKKYKKRNKKYVKKIHALLDLKKSIALDLAIVVPQTKLKATVRTSYIEAVQVVLYTLSDVLIDKFTEMDEDGEVSYGKLTNVIYELLTILFPKEKDLKFVIINILLSRKSKFDQLEDADMRTMYNRITNMALMYLNNLPKDELKDTLKLYASLRKPEDDVERRVRLRSHLNEDDYSNIFKAIKKLVNEDEKYKKLLN